MATSQRERDLSLSKDAKAPLNRLRFDQDAINFTQSQAGTSYAGSVSAVMTQASTNQDDAGSEASVYSYDSQRDAGKFVKEMEGRTFNVLNETYYLPTDDTEWTRLDKQHVAIRLGLSNYLYPDPHVVKAILRPEEGKKKRILDLGCGTGVWTIEMAKSFPEAEVVGVDLAPCPVDAASLPTNCRIEIDNVNLGLSHFREQFDLVHCRLIASGIKDFKKAMTDVENCLRPGGMCIWIDVDFDMYSNDRFLYRQFATDANPTGSWFQRITFEMRRQAVMGGSDLYTTAKELDKGFWGHELLDPETCKTASLYLPLGPWAQCRNPTQTQQLLYAGALMRQDASSMHKAIHPMLVRSGWPQETVTEWSRKADEELSGTKEPLWSRLMVAWGRKRASKDEPAPPLPPRSPRVTTVHNRPTEEVPENHIVHIPYPNYYVYETQEKSLRQAAYRNRHKNIPPAPLPPNSPAPTPTPSQSQ